MDPNAARESHRRLLDQTVSVRRFSGAAGARTHVDTDALARTIGYAPHELIGSIVQGDRKMILLADDLVAAGFVLPVTTNDAVVVRGKELAIKAADDSTHRVGDVLIAIELQVRG